MNYLKPLIDEFVLHSDPDKALYMRAYMKNKFSFYGLDSKTRTEIEEKFYKRYGYPERENLFDIVFALWDLPERECQSCAINLMQKFYKKLEEDDIKHLEKLLITKSWWDSVDKLSIWICGSYFISYPDNLERIAGLWVKNSNFWLKRASLLIQLRYKKNTNTELLKYLILQLNKEKEFFIRKAIGWVLRQYSKTNADWVRKLVNEVKLSGLSKKEAVKYL